MLHISFLKGSILFFTCLMITSWRFLGVSSGFAGGHILQVLDEDGAYSSSAR